MRKRGRKRKMWDTRSDSPTNEPTYLHQSTRPHSWPSHLKLDFITPLSHSISSRPSFISPPPHLPCIHVFATHHFITFCLLNAKNPPFDSLSSLLPNPAERTQSIGSARAGAKNRAKEKTKRPRKRRRPADNGSIETSRESVLTKNIYTYICRKCMCKWLFWRRTWSRVEVSS